MRVGLAVSAGRKDMVGLAVSAGRRDMVGLAVSAGRKGKGIVRKWLIDLRKKIVRDPLPAESVAGGWALGMFVGCAIPFGLQLLVSVPLAFMMRVSKVGATVGTLVTNPVTIFFIYPAQTWVVYNLLFGHREMGALPKEWTREAVMALSGPVIASFFLGGLFLALILSPITYFIVKRIVVGYRRRSGFRIKQQH